MGKWKPMETAPKDRVILAHTGMDSHYVMTQDYELVHWSGWGGGVWENVSGQRLSKTLRFWRDLPRPPRLDQEPADGT